MNPDVTILHLLFNHDFSGRFLVLLRWTGIPKCSIDLGEPDSSECAWWKPWNENGRTFPNATLSLVLLFEHIGNLIYFHHIWKANKVRDAISKENRGNKTNVRFRSGYWVGWLVESSGMRGPLQWKHWSLQIYWDVGTSLHKILSEFPFFSLFHFSVDLEDFQ